MSAINTKKLKKTAGKFPETPGVYIMRNRANKILYVGKAKSLKQRVANYLTKALDNKTMALMSKVKNIEYQPTNSEVEALLLEARLVRDEQPKYNVRLRDDKSFLCMAISRDKFPAVFLSRDRDKEQAGNLEYFGPFTSAHNLRRALKSLQRIFRFRTCRKMNKTGCLLYHIKLCPGPCLGKISEIDYQANIRRLKEFLQGKPAEAASVPAFYDDETKIDNKDNRIIGLREIRQGLALTELPRRMAAVDISDIKGTAAVGAIVSFRNGEPDNNGYRRYRIKTAAEGQADDYYRIREVMGRYVNRWVTEKRVFPDLILIDGGKGHLNVAANIFRGITAKDIKRPALTALAKGRKNKPDKLYVFLDNKIQALRIGDAGLKILQYLRDEAHRFAQSYHHLLRKKSMLEK